MEIASENNVTNMFGTEREPMARGWGNCTSIMMSFIICIAIPELVPRD
jgi:hypothetical protein